MRNVGKLLKGAFLLLQIADLLTTGIAGIEYEANPAAVLVWSRYGFGALVLGKIGLLALVLGANRVIRWLSPIASVVYLALNCSFYALLLMGNAGVLASILRL